MTLREKIAKRGNLSPSKDMERTIYRSIVIITAGYLVSTAIALLIVRIFG